MPKKDWTIEQRLMMNEITDTERKILSALIRKGEATQAQLAKDTRMHYVTIHKEMKAFENARWVNFSRLGTSEKKVPMKFYVPSVRSMIVLLFDDFLATFGNEQHVFWTDKHRGSDLSQIARKNARVLPLIFGKWELFEREGLGDYAEEKLKFAVVYTYERPLTKTYMSSSGTFIANAFDAQLDDTAHRSPDDENRFWTDVLQYYFYSPFLAQLIEDLMVQDKAQVVQTSSALVDLSCPNCESKWVKSICRDKELKELVKTLYDQRKKSLDKTYKFALEELDRYKHTLES